MRPKPMQEYVIEGRRSWSEQLGLMVEEATVVTPVSWSAYVQFNDIIILDSKEWQVIEIGSQTFPVFDGNVVRNYWRLKLRTYDDSMVINNMKAQFTKRNEGQVTWDLDNPERVTVEMEQRVQQDLESNNLLPPVVEFNDRGIGVDPESMTVVMQQRLTEEGIRVAIEKLSELGYKKLWVGGKLVYDKDKVEEERKERWKQQSKDIQEQEIYRNALSKGYRKPVELDRSYGNSNPKDGGVKRMKPVVKVVTARPEIKSNPLEEKVRLVDMDD